MFLSRYGIPMIATSAVVTVWMVISLLIPEKTVNFEESIQRRSEPINNAQPQNEHLLPCLRNIFKDVLLVVTYNFPFYDSIPLLKELYKGAFPRIIFCGPERNDSYGVMVVKLEKGYWGYECLGKAARENPNYRGYLYINDDMILNWWNLIKLDRDRIWQGSRILNKLGIDIDDPHPVLKWTWWNSTAGLKQCKLALSDIKNTSNVTWNEKQLLNNLKQNGKGKLYCLRGWSDIFYIPGKLRQVFADLSAIFFKRKVFLEIAVTVLQSLLGLRDENEKLHGVYIPDVKHRYKNVESSLIAWNEYNLNLSFIHPFKLHGKHVDLNTALLKHWVIRISKTLTKC